MSVQEIYNYRNVDEQVATAGQPTEDQLREAAREGFQTVINLATLDDRGTLPDEAGLVRSLGLAYYHIPVVWTNPTQDDFAAFEQAMAESEGCRTLIHCAANFRVTAFYSLYALKRLGWSEERADAFRASIWKGSDYPAWERFVRLIKEQIAQALRQRGAIGGSV
jgi:uncharacterized protein (TIGR01244 family)